MDVFLTILDVFLPVSGCKNASIGCIYDSNSLYDCIIDRGFYTLTNIHHIFLPVVKKPCTRGDFCIISTFALCYLSYIRLEKDKI